MRGDGGTGGLDARTQPAPLVGTPSHHACPSFCPRQRRLPAVAFVRQGFLSGYPNLPHNELHQDWQGRFMFGLRFFLKVRDVGVARGRCVGVRREIGSGSLPWAPVATKVYRTR